MITDYSRLDGAVDREMLSGQRVAFVGCGGSRHLITNLTRCGADSFLLIDPDTVSAENLCRTDFEPRDVGQLKVEVLKHAIHDLNPFASVHCKAIRFRELALAGTFHGDYDVWELTPAPSLIIAASDSFECQAAVNSYAVANRCPALFIGLNAHGRGGEIVFWREGLPCFGCLLSKRYQLHEASTNPSVELDPPSTGSTVFDLDFVDSIAGQIALGILLEGSSTRFGSLLHSLGDRNYLRVKIDPQFMINGKDLVQQELGIQSTNEHFSGWCVSVQRDPTRGCPPCRDCRMFGHRAYDKSSAATSLPPPNSPEACENTSGKGP
jgi:hypothetical protein